MRNAIWRRRWALVCASALLLLLPLVQPWLQMGTNDDPSYIRTAQLLAETGHILYNGWAVPILGWQLYLGAAFIKLFGFSFTLVRLSMLPVGMAAAYLTQRSMVRAGLTEWNASLATLTLVLSPIFVPLTFSYMTDIGGYFVLVLCFYCCLRAVQASTELRACGWIVFAAITNGIGGTSRQTGWLGLLVIIPCTLWWMRKRRRVVIYGVTGLCLGLGIMWAVMQWYKHQPYSIVEGAQSAAAADPIVQAVRSVSSELFEIPLFLLPVLLPFTARLDLRNKRVRWVIAGGVLVTALLLGVILTRPDPVFWMEPCGRNYMTAYGAVDGTFIHGQRPLVLHEAVRLVLTLLVFVGVWSTAAFAVQWKGVGLQGRSPAARWRLILLLSLPFLLVYFGLLLPRAMKGDVFDRYLIPMLFVALLVIVRFYQDEGRADLPRFTWVLIAVMAAYSAATTHDAFAMLRARLEAAEEVRSSGVPAKQIDGGWEYNSWTQLQLLGYLDSDGMRLPAGVEEPAETLPELTCRPQMWNHSRVLRPQYALSFDPNACSGPAGFPAVVYHEWLGPRTVPIYVVRVSPGAVNDISHY